MKAISEATLRRLPTYYHYLEIVNAEGLEYASSTTIANHMGLDPVQVRKDLQVTGVLGKPKSGFKVSELLTAIAAFLNWTNKNSAFLAGAGNLGKALIGYPGFEKYGMSIVAAFDTDPLKNKMKVSNIPILPLGKLPELAERMHVHIGIITTPANVAQEVADLMIEGGIKALWNFAPVHLVMPEDIIVENAQFSTSLAVLTRKLGQTAELELV